MSRFAAFALCLLLAACAATAKAAAGDAGANGPRKVLYFTLSAGFRHEVVPESERILRELGARSGRFEVTVSQDPAVLNARELAKYDALVFYTTGELPIDARQKQDLLDFVEGGKGFVGVHSATDTFYDWPAYGRMLGGYFDKHPWHEEVTVKVEDQGHPATRHLGARFAITDEIYQFRDWSRDDVHVLLRLDTASVDLSKDDVHRTDDDFALAWTREQGQGRVFYTALGHRPEVWRDPRFQRLLVGGLLWSMRADAGAHAENRAQADRPALSRFGFIQPHMGTAARVVLYAPDEAGARRAADAAFARIGQLDAILSDYRDDSELSRLAARAGEGPVAVGEDLFAVLQAAQSLARRSDGAFDVARGTVTRLWRQARRLDEAPDPARLQAALDAGSWRDIALDPTARTVALARPGMRLDVGGIAKGYATGQALQTLRAAGFERAMVALGGDIAVGAPPPGAPGWRIHVAALAVPGAPDYAVLELHDAAVSTAGDAEQWMEIGGVRLSHVLDARSGRPLDFRSTTTVIAPHGLQADGLDTAASILGPEAGLRLVAGVPGAAVLMVRQAADGRVQRVASAGWPLPDPSAASAALETSR